MIQALSPILNELIQLLASAILGLGSWAIVRVLRWLRLSEDEKVRGYLNAALDNAVGWAVADLRRRMPSAELGPGVGHAARVGVVNEAASYIAQRVPDALKRFGVTPEGVRDMVEKRLVRELG
jgi:hypothetical protein